LPVSIHRFQPEPNRKHRNFFFRSAQGEAAQSGGCQGSRAGRAPLTNHISAFRPEGGGYGFPARLGETRESSSDTHFRTRMWPRWRVVRCLGAVLTSTKRGGLEKINYGGRGCFESRNYFSAQASTSKAERNRARTTSHEGQGRGLPAPTRPINRNHSFPFPNHGAGSPRAPRNPSTRKLTEGKKRVGVFADMRDAALLFVEK